jgi:Skp family chaperone for outer membrane proteins
MMKKFIVAFFTFFIGLGAFAQGTKPVKIGYIDMNYILEKSPDYAEAKNQLEIRAGKWKQEMDAKSSEIKRLKDGLQAEKALLTKELIEEREEEIQFLEKDLSDYQQEKFGPNGELISQKAVLVKPIQDQVFTIIQDLAQNRKYDFIFDKSSDLTMLFAAKKYDLSDLIVKRLSRAAKTEKLSSKEQKALEAQEREEELMADPEHQEREKAREEKKAEREKKLEERKAQQEEKRRAAEEKREQLKAEREAKKNGTTTPAQQSGATTDGGANSTQRTSAPGTETDAAEDKPAATTAQEKAAAAKEERERKAAERKAAVEARKKKIEEDKEAARKKREEKKNQQQGTQTETTTPSEPTGDDPLPTGGGQ